jgi:GntR family galactonate operon transcriptional repressor
MRSSTIWSRCGRSWSRLGPDFAAARATLDDLGRIGDACEVMRQAIGDMAAYAQADVRFHKAIFAASHNTLLRRFAHLVANVLQVSFRIQQDALREPGERLKQDLALHLAIAEAINRSDAAAAGAGMLRAILDGKRYLQRARARAKRHQP